MNLFAYVKSKVSILDVINEYVTLKKGGIYYKGNCPFHSEKTASFTVSPHKEIFYCFGCHVSGDVISFIATIEHCSQKEAADHLIERFGLEVPTSIRVEKEASSEGQVNKKRYFELCSLVAQWAHKNLNENKETFDYFIQRGFTKQTLQLFNIGYFPGGSKALESLIKFVSAQSFLADDLLSAQIIAQGKHSRYSPFEERLIFPIKDLLGRTCGFGGRIFKKNDERAKYYNSHENQYFTKGSLFFGFDLAKQHFTEQHSKAYIVEGYTDCMAMAQMGYTNALATLGTACTSEHLKTIARYVHTLYVVYDGDQAGQKAMLRLAELCWEVNLELFVVNLPPGEDPASLLSKHGSIDKFLHSYKDIFQFYIDSLGVDFARLPLNEKLKNTQKLISILKNINDELKRDLLVQRASEALAIPFESLKAELQRALPEEQEKQPIKPQTAPQPGIDQISLLEKKLFSVILSDVTLLQKINSDYVIKHFTPPLRDVLHALNKAGAEGSIDFVAFFDTLPQDQQQLVAQLLLECEDADPSKTFEQLLIQFQKKYWKEIVHDIKMKLTEAEHEENDQKVKELLITFQELKKKLLSKGLL
jgi:DNA primase